MGNDINLITIAKFIIMLLGAGGFGGLAVHFFASGNVLVKDRRIDKDILNKRIDELELALYTLRNEHEQDLESMRDQNFSVQKDLNKICVYWDSMNTILAYTAEALEKNQPLPPIYLQQIKSWKSSSEILKPTGPL